MSAIRIQQLALILMFLMAVATSPCVGITWPIQCGRSDAPITSSYGARCLNGIGDFHAGIDVRIWNSTNVVAVASGTVVDVSYWSGYSGTVILKHGSGTNSWYTGYHHINSDSEEDIFVDVGQTVTEGQLIAKAGSDHLHFNYWNNSYVSENDDNTLHPLRMLGGGGIFSISVFCPCVPVGALRIDHCGQLVEVGVGVGTSGYSTPYYSYVWNYEGNVRDYDLYYGSYEPGDCYLGLDLCTGISPSSYDATYGTSTCFTYPTDKGSWTLNNPDYTYALSVDGSKIVVEFPVSVFYESYTATISETDVTIRWEVVQDGLNANDFSVFRGQSDELMAMRIDIKREAARVFSITDENLDRGTTYYYRIDWTNLEKTISTGVIEVTLPGNISVFLDTPYPNPFRGKSFARCGIPAGKTFEVTVYDVKGALVKILRQGLSRQNEYTIEWDGTNMKGIKVARGCYFFRLSVKGHTPIVRKIILLE